ncbi:MAG TPA: hypothetical protein VEF72_04405 [Mycobacterium sp.]|nr:hypothetical protein [Mycobacterium sp.]
MRPEAEPHRLRDPRRGGQRSLGAAEGLVVALRHCSLDEAFIYIVQTAKRHNVAPTGLADALVAIAENDVTRDFDDMVVAAVVRAWGALSGRPSDAPDRERTEQLQLPIAPCASSWRPKLTGHRW